MLLHYHHNSLLLLTQSSAVLTPFSLISNNNNNNNAVRKGRPVSLGRRAVEREESLSSSEFEVDRDKAREALDKLDKQLLSLSSKPPPPPPSTTTNLTRAQYLDRQLPQVREEAPDFSGSFLPYSTFVLLLFSIFYNVIFATVIKPSIDFPEQVETNSVGKSPIPKPRPSAPSTTDTLKL